MNKNSGSLTLLIIVAALPALFFTGDKIKIDKETERAHEQAALETLSSEQEQTVQFKEYKIKTTFEQQEDYKVATASSEWGSVEKRDYNKSKIAGRYIGSKVKPFTKGLVEGLKE